MSSSSSFYNPFPRLLISFNLNKNIQMKFKENDIQLVSELSLLNNDELINNFGFTEYEVTEIERKVKSPPCFGFSFVNYQKHEAYISSGCQAIDKALGGKGLPTGRLTQISGEPGAGKTQICMQLCLRVQLDVENGGLDAEAVYLDAENAFHSEIIYRMAYNYFKKTTTENNLLNFKTKEVFTRIHIRKIHNSDDLCNLILNGQLDYFFQCHSNVKLLILDSIAYHFRYDYQYRNEIRIKQLNQIVTKLKQMAFDRNIAILLTNHVKWSDKSPTLGNLWNSLCPTSLHLTRIDNDENLILNDRIHIKSQRICNVLKSPNAPHHISFHYSITGNGIEDLKSQVE